MIGSKKIKVYISVDIEGVSGVIHWNETEHGKQDYDYFRKIMTSETNAAVEAAFEQGASDVLVRDAHGSALNILPGELHKEAKLIRNWSGSPYGMMDGISMSFDAAVFIGYHAKAGTPHATLKHTMNSTIADLRMNGVSLAEASFNALIAGQFKVPVVFISGDRAICDYMKKFSPDIEAVAVKEGLGNASICMHPEKARELIKFGVKSGLKKRTIIPPYIPEAPYNFEIQYTNEHSAYKAKWYPGAKRVDAYTVRLKTKHVLDVMRFFYFCEG